MEDHAAVRELVDAQIPRRRPRMLPLVMAVWFGVGFCSLIPAACWLATGVLVLRGQITEEHVDAP